MTRTALRAVLVTVVIAVAVVAAAPGLQSIMEPKEGAPTTESAWTVERMESWIKGAPGNLWLAIGPKALAALLGVFFLVQEFLRPEKIRHGLLPPPDGRGPTVVASAGGALGLAVAVPLLIQLLMPILFRSFVGDVRFSVLIAVVAFLPTALLVVLRRQRLGGGRVARAGRGIVEGLRFTCIAMLVLWPVALAWAVLLMERGVTMEVQGPVQQFITPATPDVPWVVAGFGALLAPFNEEAVFRGLLYPSLRGRVPGGPLGAAVVVALVFAAVHGNFGAFLPLFALALVLCWVMERTNSLLACVVVHGIHNTLTLIPLLWRHVQGVAA